MPQRSVVAVGASLLVASLALAGCGTRDDSGSDSTGSAPARTRSPRSASSRPCPVTCPRSAWASRTRSTSPSSRPTSQRDPRHHLRGRRPRRPGQARRRQERRHQARRDDDVLGVVGTLNSSVAQSVAAGLRHRQDHPGLPGQHRTRPSPWAPTSTTAPKRAVHVLLPHLHHRLLQGPFAAQYLYETAGIKKVSTIHDKKTYGQGLVAAVHRGVQELGGKSSPPRRSTPTTTTSPPSSPRSSRSSPEVVYYGGEYPQAGPLCSR